MGEMGRGQATRALAKESPGGSPGVGRRRGREPRPRPGEARAPGRPPYQREQEAPEQGCRGPGQRPLRPHRTAGRPATRRFSAGTGSGSRRCAASVAGPDRRGRRGLAGAAAAIAAAAAAPTSSSGSAQRTRKPPRGARGVRVRARRQSGWFSALYSAGVGRPPTVGLGVSLSLSSCLTRTLPRVRGGGGGRPKQLLQYLFFLGVTVRLLCTPVPTRRPGSKSTCTFAPRQVPFTYTYIHRVPNSRDLCIQATDVSLLQTGLFKTPGGPLST